MHRRTIAAAIAGAAALAGVLAGAPAASASAATYESCTINMPVGPVHVLATWRSNGLTKTGTVDIYGAERGPVLLMKDRVGWQRGAAGMVAAGRLRSWDVRYPVGFYTHAGVSVKDSSGVARGCVTR